MKLTTKKIQVKNYTLQCDVIREQVEDLKYQLGFFHSSSINDFYIRKEILLEDKIIDNDLIKITNYSIKYYHIKLNLKLWYRILKLSKIFNDEKHKKTVKTIKYYIENKIESPSITEEILVDELADSINKEIIKNIMKLK